MKRKSLLFLLLMAMFAPLAMNGQTQLLFENFDSMSSISTSYSGTGWYAYNAGSGNNWTLFTPSSSEYTHSGANVARVAYNANYAANCYLVSKPFTVSADMNKLTVSLYQKCSNDNYAETFEVFFVKASNVTTLSAVASATHYSAIASASYTNTDFIERTGFVTSSDLAGQSVRVVVHCTSAKDMAYLYIDDITVTETTSGGGQGGGDCEDFESYSSTANTSISTNSGLPTGWSAIFSGSNSGYTPHLYKGNYALDGVGIVMTSGSSTYGNNNYVISNITLQTGDEISFNAYRESSSTSSTYGTLTYGYITGTTAGTFVGIGTATTEYYYNGSATGGANSFTVPAAANGYKLAWRWTLTSSYYSAVIDNVCVTSSNPTYSVTAASGISNGNLMFTSNGGGSYVYSPLTGVEAGTDVIINTIPDAGYQLSGTPTLTVTSGTAPALTQTDADHFTFVMPASDVTVNANFTCITPADPTFSVASGTYTSVQNVTISCATAGATIYYTTDGSTPTSSSTQYTGAITINSTTTLKAIAYIGTCTSNVTTATYTMSLPTYTVTCATGLTGGSIAANPTSAVEGTTITITATPESGYFIGTITATDANNNDVTVTVNGNAGTFTMPASNVTVTATFTQGFHVTLNQTPNGTISADQTTNLQPGDIVTLTATPDNDCVFLAWYIFKDGNPRDVIAAVNNSWFFMPSSNVTVQAVFVTEESHEQTVGGGDNTNANLPTNVYMKYSLTQQIYTAAEIGYTGRITAIAFKANGTATRSLEVYMAHTDLSAFSSTSSWETMGSVSKVFSGSVSFSSTDWTTITLDTPFEYDGTSNLNICVADRTGGWVSTITFNTYSTSANRALYINDDNTDYGAGVGYAQTLSGYSGTQSTSNNQIKFTIKVAGSAESLTISPDEISDFSYVEGQGPSEIHKLDIVGVDLENDITITAPTNFEVCLTENGTYASTVTVPRETGSKSRGLTTWNFEGSMEGWTTIDADGDGNNWILGSASANVYCVSNPFANGAGPNGSSDGLVTASYSNYLGVLTPDNWIVSPQVTLGGSFSMWTMPYQVQYPNEHFGIYVSTSSDPTNTSSYILLNEWTMTNTNWAQYSVDLSAFANQSGYIAVRHFNCSDVYVMLADNFVLDTDAAISVEMPVTITPATVFVRMKDNLGAGTYSGTLTASAGSGTNVNGSVSLSGEVIPVYTITLTANPAEGGAVTGAGQYVSSASVLVKARANSPYQFINWTENGTVVSTDADFTITVTGDRNLVANFGFKKDIIGYGSSAGCYYLIASPIGNVAPINVTNMTNYDSQTGIDTYKGYDLFYFDQSRDMEWVNYKPGTGSGASNPGFNLVAGKGYLYANKNNVTLVFAGQAHNTQDMQVVLDRTETGDGYNIDLPGWNLVGNPYAEVAYIDIYDEDERPFYTMNGGGTAFEAATNGSIDPMEGVFVIAEEDGETMTFSTTEPTSKGKGLALNLSDGHNRIDRAIVRFNKGRTLPKLMLFENSSKVYIPMDGQDYAVVRSEEVGEMPVNFKAENNGSYTLSLSVDNVEFGYLHLIDNMTGMDIDLLQTPSYTFEAKTTDYESRFKLVFATGNNSKDDNFAYFSNGSFVINNDGEATLQVIDIMGRILKSENINGCANMNVNAAPGVYMLRLVNGDNVKVQKVVVK